MKIRGRRVVIQGGAGFGSSPDCVETQFWRWIIRFLDIEDSGNSLHFTVSDKRSFDGWWPKAKVLSVLSVQIFRNAQPTREHGNWKIFGRFEAWNYSLASAALLLVWVLELIVRPPTIELCQHWCWAHLRTLCRVRKVTRHRAQANMDFNIWS